MPKTMKSYIGERFGGLVVLEEISSSSRNRKFLVRCDYCDEEKVYYWSNLSKRKNPSCGCLDGYDELFEIPKLDHVELVQNDLGEWMTRINNSITLFPSTVCEIALWKKLSECEKVAI